MGAPAKRAQSCSGLRVVQRLIEQPVLTDEYLVAAENECARMIGTDGKGFAFGQMLGDNSAPGRRHLRAQLVLVDLGRNRRELDASRGQHGPPAGAARSQDEFRPRHDLPSRSASRLRIAAAVSSIERRVTSMEGHSLLSNNLRVAATSARTASSST